MQCRCRVVLKIPSIATEFPLNFLSQDAVSVAGGAIGAMHIPEKWFPGSMDYYLNSHNIMHVLVVLAVYSMHQVSPQMEYRRRKPTDGQTDRWCLCVCFVSPCRPPFRTWIGCRKLSALWALQYRYKRPR